MGYVDYTYAKNVLNAQPKGQGTDRFYSLPEGTESVLVRILPPYEGARIPGKFVYKHYNIPGDNSSVNCLRTWDMECPMCKMIEEYSARTDVSDFEMVTTSYLNVLVLKDPTNPSIPRNEPRLLRDYGTNLKWLLENILNEEVGERLIDPYNGHSVTFTREKYKGKFRRDISLSPTAIGANQEEIQNILSKMHNCDKIWPSPDDQSMQNFYKAVAAVKDIIENKIMTAGQMVPPTQQYAPPPAQQYAPPVQQQAPAYSPPVQPPVQAAPAQQPVVAPPVQAPAPQPVVQQPVAAPIQQPVAQPAPQPQTKTVAAGAPECYANKDVFYAGFGSSSNVPKDLAAQDPSGEKQAQVKKCTVCPYEFQCEQEVEKCQ